MAHRAKRKRIHGLRGWELQDQSVQLESVIPLLLRYALCPMRYALFLSLFLDKPGFRW
jgi:hypothetical protein